MLSHSVSGLSCQILSSSHPTDDFWRWKPLLPEQSRAKQGLCLGLKLHVPAHLPGMSLGAFLVPPQQGTWGQITLTSTLVQPLGSTTTSPAALDFGKPTPKCSNSFCSNNKSGAAPLSQILCAIALPPAYLPAINGALRPNRGLFIQLAHECVLLGFNHNVWF